MNKKLIVAAVAASVAAPATAMAGDAVLYGRINNAIDMKDVDGGASTTHLTDIVSRIGIKYSNELSNGLTVKGQYELSANSDNEGPNAIGDTRVAYAGVAGPFGEVRVGQQWSAYFDTFGTLVSPTYSLGYYIYSSVGGGPFRASNTIKYSNTFGPVYLEVDRRINDEESREGSDVAEKIAGPGFGIGVSFSPLSGLTLAGAIDVEDAATDSGLDDPTRTGFAAKYSFGNLWVAGGLQSYESESAGSAAVAAVTTAVTGIHIPTAGGAPATHAHDDNAAADNGGAPAGAVIVRPAVATAAAVPAGANTKTEVDSQYLWIGGSLGEKTSWMLGLTSAEDKDKNEADQTTIGIYHNVGGGLRFYLEGVAVDATETGGDELTRTLLGMRVDF